MPEELSCICLECGKFLHYKNIIANPASKKFFAKMLKKTSLPYNILLLRNECDLIDEGISKCANNVFSVK